jgi:YD repeat-containing protein
VYDGSHQVTSWINPLGDRTSFTYLSSGLAITSPLGAVTTLINGSLPGGAFRPRTPGVTFGAITNPLGNVATLGFDANGNQLGATAAAGNITSYSWDTSSRLLTIGDGLGNTTSFGYARVTVRWSAHG